MRDVLQRLSTGAFADLPDGAARPATFCTPQGRLVDAVRALRRGGDVWLVGAPGNGPGLAAHLDRFIISEDVTVTAEPGLTLAAVGPNALHEAAVATGLAFRPDHVTEDGAARCWVEPAGTSSVVCWQGPPEALRARAESLGARGAVSLPSAAFDAWRVAVGWPGAAEIGGDWNPLEAGLGPALDFRKGCYIGQEVVARLWYYDKQKRVLARVRLDSDPGPCPVACDGDAGTVTSAAPHPGDAWRGLAYLRVAAAAPGATVRAGAASGTVLGRVGSDPDAPPPTSSR